MPVSGGKEDKDGRHLYQSLEYLPECFIKRVKDELSGFEGKKLL